ncbi:hypothetical protein QN219_04740 [Sinorhizobium sp. 7-81]|uniref:hypothetical protein n=1 Tax=Sinorhizobium sp. 8-89 TaxID=3049089 RepID=UPI0024C3EA02|nr:hypothetical protein [Sinorhizobium sp. 8-89]MDK1489363.1 hypothetical protein [Sinorhizobium sp. 8-89]
MIRIRIQNIGGSFPGRGAAPEMTRDFHLPRGERTAIDRLGDRAAFRAKVSQDAGSLVAANDNTRNAKKEDAA